jgi:hypothetical protein
MEAVGFCIASSSSRISMILLGAIIPMDETHGKQDMLFPKVLTSVQ